MRPLFYLSENQLRIKPFFLSLTVFPVSMTDASSAVSFTSSSTDLSGRMLLMNTVHTRRCTTGSVFPDCSKATLQGILRGRAELESVIHSDGWAGYDGLVDLGYQRHSRVEHGNNEFANRHSHINGMESFLAFDKTRLARFSGLQSTFFTFI